MGPAVIPDQDLQPDGDRRVHVEPGAGQRHRLETGDRRGVGLWWKGGDNLHGARLHEAHGAGLEKRPTVRHPAPTPSVPPNRDPAPPAGMSPASRQPDPATFRLGVGGSDHGVHPTLPPRPSSGQRHTRRTPVIWLVTAPCSTARMTRVGSTMIVPHRRSIPKRNSRGVSGVLGPNMITKASGRSRSRIPSRVRLTMVVRGDPDQIRLRQQLLLHFGSEVVLVSAVAAFEDPQLAAELSQTAREREIVR